MNDNVKPNYSSMGLARCMGPALKQEIERQLNRDLEHYGASIVGFRYDWSDSCIEGKCIAWLDGVLENFSGIRVFNEHDVLLATGWMEYIEVGSNLIIYWDWLKIYQGETVIPAKSSFGIPSHSGDDHE